MKTIVELLTKKSWKSWTGLLMCAIAIGSGWANAHHLLAWIAPDWLLPTGQGLLSVGLIHKLSKLKGDIAILKPLIEPLVPALGQLVKDAKVPVEAETTAPGAAKTLLLVLALGLVFTMTPRLYAADNIGGFEPADTYTPASTPATPRGWLELGPVKGWWPWQKVEFNPYVHGTKTGIDYIGADWGVLTTPQKPIDLSWITIPPDFARLNLGVITSEQASGAWYGSVSINLLQIVTHGPTFFSYIGAGYMIDTHDRDNNQWVIATSIPLESIKNWKW